MSTSGSPAKRRKKNDSTASPHKGPTLDYFFGKKNAVGPTQNTSAMPTSRKSQDEKPIAAPDFSADGEEPQLSDEQLARKLQEEWAKEDKLASGSNVAKEAGTDKSAEDQEALDREFARKLRSADDKGVDGAMDTAEEGSSSKPTQTTAAIFGQASKPTEKTSVSLQEKTEWEAEIAAVAFDEDPLTFDPESLRSLMESFPGGKATYGLLTRCFALVNSTRSRIKIVDTLVNFLRTLVLLDPESLLPAVWLTTNDIGPPYEDTELGLGGSIISKALLKVCGVSAQTLRTLHNKYGDAGDVAFEAKVKQRTLQMKKYTPLSIKKVYASLQRISGAKGQGSRRTKQNIVERLLLDSRGEEVRYLTRTLVQHLRIGAVKTTMLIALSRAFLMTQPPDAKFAAPHSPSELKKMLKDKRTEIYSGAEEIAKQCFARRPNYSDLVPALLEHGLDGVKERCGLGLHVPLKPMLGSITRDLGEMLSKAGPRREFTAEYKYDGQRAQIHCDAKGKVSIFSRHLELMTDKYPDLVALVPTIRREGVESFIMEGEVVAIDSETGDLKTFQTLSSRARKDVAIGSVSVNVCLYAFDLMYLNGEELLGKPLRERRQLMRDNFTPVDKKFGFVKSIDATGDDQDALLEFFKGSLEQKCEGIMVKLLDNEVTTADNENGEAAAPSTKAKEKKKGARRKALLATYEPDKRLESWLKVKKDYDSSTDTLDVIPIAAWHGMGRKAAWWSPILFAVRNPETGSLEAVCKCMSGFTDAFYKEMKSKYSEDGDNTSREPKGYYEAAGLRPDIWFEPLEVWEIVFADITVSPNYTAAIGLVHEEKGLSLRFPRFLKKRDDKSIDEASTNEDLAALYRKQERSAKEKKDDGGSAAAAGEDVDILEEE